MRFSSNFRYVIGPIEDHMPFQVRKPSQQYHYKNHHETAHTTKIPPQKAIVSDRLNYKERPDLYITDCSFEYCIVEVKLKHENVLLCSGYRAPNTNPASFLTDYEKLLTTVDVEKK